MKNHRPVWLAFVCWLALLPSLLSGSPWDPNLPRPAGFQRTLGYLADDFHEYPNGELQSIRSKMLTQDNVTGIVAALQNSGIPPSGWEAEAQKTYDVWAAQYEQLKTVTRQTMTNAEGIIQAVEGNQPLSAELAGHPNVRALIAARWRLINLGEQTYQALVYAGLLSGGGSGSPQTSVPIITSRKPAKSQNRIDWERTRETWRRAIERRRAFEARLAEKNRRRLAEILELTRYLQNHGAQSTNKFQARAGGGTFVPTSAAEREAPADEPDKPAETESAEETLIEPADSSIEDIERLQVETNAIVQRMLAEGLPKPEATKVKVFRGTLVLGRHPSWTDEIWPAVKKSYIELFANNPEISDLDDQGDKVTWRYKSLTLPSFGERVEVIPDGEPTEEEAPGQSPPEQKPEEETPGDEKNGDASQDGLEGKTVPGTEQPAEEPPKPQVAPKPAAKPVAAKPAPKPEAPKPAAKQHDGYWYDPSDRTADEDDPTIYVRFNGQAIPVKLSRAKEYGVPDDITIDQMSWYSEKFKKVVEDRKTHRPKKQ
jgi:hypothetical protein